MKRLWSGLFKDTLTKRLFLLIWGTLLISHLLVLLLGHHDGRASWRACPAGAGSGTVTQTAWGGVWLLHPFDLVHVLGYVVRLVVTGLAAWLGAHWLTAPMRHLAEAAESMGHALSRGEPVPQLNACEGTLEVRQTAQVFNNMVLQLQGQFEERSLLMAAMSHDLRTPLTRLRIRLERLLPDPHAERCVEDVHAVNSMIESVLDVLNEERRQESSQVVNVLALVQALADDRVEEGQAVTAEGESAVIRVQVVAFTRVLDNLVNNALRYGGWADIRVCRGEGRVRVTIDDRGPGIPDEMIPVMFKPFVRLEASRSRDTGGVGLGLYIVQQLTQRNGGEIRLSNRPEGGLRAELDFPELAAS